MVDTFIRIPLDGSQPHLLTAIQLAEQYKELAKSTDCWIVDTSDNTYLAEDLEGKPSWYEIESKEANEFPQV